MFDWDAVPHKGMPYVQIGFNMALYISSLLVREFGFSTNDPVHFVQH
jgi:hypothetical protein